MKKFRKSIQIQPDLDCGIYPNDNEIFLPENIEKIVKSKMPEKPDYAKISSILYPSGGTNNQKANYMRVVPNSHFWTDLNQILTTIIYHQQRMAYESEKHEDNITVNFVDKSYDKEYFIIGLENSIKNGYKIKQVKNLDFNQLNGQPFMSVEEIIEYIKKSSFDLSDYKLNQFMTRIHCTLDIGLNLTNGLKMQRAEVYSRIDGERDYQDNTWSIYREMIDTPDEEKPVAEWINYIEYHISKAKDRVYHLSTNEALAEVRKVAALAVRCMEIHGCPERIIKNDCSDGKKEK